jgi:hypothetical protein
MALYWSRVYWAWWGFAGDGGDRGGISHFVPGISYHSENHFRTITIYDHFVPYADRYIITISYHIQIDTL